MLSVEQLPSSFEIEISKPIELIVLGIKQASARCRLLDSGKELTLRASTLWDVAPGEIVTVLGQKHWTYARNHYLSGEIMGSRFDLSALHLIPLQLVDAGTWDPKEEYWGGEDKPLPEWTQEIIARGPRPKYEMGQVVPGVNPEDLDIDTDPILQAVELRDARHFAEAGRILVDLLTADLRCLDAHAHLGNFELDGRPENALRHYDIGRQIGDLSLGPDFSGVLPWALIDNRPYLRCLHGYGLALWHLSRFDEAASIFTRMLWLNPSDNQGVRFLVDDVRAEKASEHCSG